MESPPPLVRLAVRHLCKLSFSISGSCNIFLNCGNVEALVKYLNPKSKALNPIRSIKDMGNIVEIVNSLNG